MNILNTRYYAPISFQGYASSTDLPREILVEIFKEVIYINASTIALTSKEWYQIAISNPVISMRNLIIQLNKVGETEVAKNEIFIELPSSFSWEETSLISKDIISYPTGCLNFLKFINPAPLSAFTLLRKLRFDLLSLENCRDEKVQFLIDITQQAFKYSMSPNVSLDGLDLNEFFKKHHADLLINAVLNKRTLNQRKSAFFKKCHELLPNCHDKQLALSLVRYSYQSLKYLSVEFKKDPRIALAAIKQKGEAFYWAGESLKENKEFILAAMRLKRNIVIYLPENLKIKREIN